MDNRSNRWYNKFFTWNTHFAISLALKFDDVITIGLIFDPIKNEIFYAEKNNGSYLNNSRIRVSNKSNLKNVYLLQ